MKTTLTIDPRPFKRQAKKVTKILRTLEKEVEVLRSGALIIAIEAREEPKPKTKPFGLPEDEEIPAGFFDKLDKPGTATTTQEVEAPVDVQEFIRAKAEELLVREASIRDPHRNREHSLQALLDSANEEIATLRNQLEASETQKDQLADALGKLLGASPTASVASLIEEALKRSTAKARNNTLTNE